MKIGLERQQAYFWLAVLIWCGLGWSATGTSYAFLPVALIGSYAIWRLNGSDRLSLYSWGAALGLLSGIAWMSVFALVTGFRTPVLSPGPARPDHITNIVAGVVAAELRWHAIKAHAVGMIFADLKSSIRAAYDWATIPEPQRLPLASAEPGTRGHALPSSTPSMKHEVSYDTELADKIFTRLIAFIQILVSLSAVFPTLILFNYGGAAANPGLFLGIMLFLFWGLVSGIFLFFRILAARLLAMPWHGVAIGFAIWLTPRLPMRPSPAGARRSDSLALFFALAFLYLALTSFPKIYGAAKRNPVAMRKLAAGCCVVLIILTGYYFIGAAISRWWWRNS